MPQWYRLRSCGVESPIFDGVCREMPRNALLKLQCLPIIPLRRCGVFQPSRGTRMQATTHTSQLGFGRSQWSRPAPKIRDSCRADLTFGSGLSIKVLRNAAERSVIAELRRYAPIGAERDLNAGFAELEELKDRLGVVVAIYREGEAMATIRAIPSGHGVTLAEKSWSDVTKDRAEYGERSWEIGRLIVAPEHRSAELLSKCLALALQQLIKASAAKYLHASCSPLMARLYRRFGFVTEKSIQGDSGMQHALIYADIGNVERALKLTPTLDKSAPQGSRLYSAA